MDKFASLSPLSLAALGVGSFAVYVLGTWAYNLWFHPLRHVPGPWYAAMSPMWLTVTDLRFKKTDAIHTLLQQYGGIVRIHPNQVVFLDQGVTRFVYNKFPKSTWYEGFKMNGYDNSMSTKANAPHAVIKRAYSPHYNPTNIALYQHEIHESINLLMDKLHKNDGKQPFDCMVIFRRALIDILFFTIFGQRIPGLEEWDITNPSADPSHEMVEAVTAFPVLAAIKMLLPRLVLTLFDMLPIPSVRAFFDSDKIVTRFVVRTRDQILAKDPNFKATGALNTDNGDERLPLLQRLLRQSLHAKAEDKLSETSILSEVVAHTMGGVDTSNIVLSFMCYLLATRPDIMEKLREELDPLMDGVEGKRQILEYAVISELPYMNAFYMELLRVYMPTPAALERVVPPSLNGDFEIKGYKLPAGTIVSTQGWSIHRDPTVFEDPEAFKPERWLDPTDKMRANWVPYGMGARYCAGFNLAHVTLRSFTAAIVRNFDLVLPLETTPESMRTVTAFVLMPVSHQVKIIFKPRAN